MLVNLSHPQLTGRSTKPDCVRFNTFLHFCYLLSFISICVNTPTNHCMWTNSIYVVFLVDLFVTLIFIIDLNKKLDDNDQDILRVKKLEVFLVIIHVISLVTQVRIKVILLEIF